MKNLKTLIIILLSNLTFAQTKSPEIMIKEIAEQWVGHYDNHRQVANNRASGDPTAPEQTEEKREMVIVKLDAPQFGEMVLYLEEMKASSPNLAHRQRVMSLTFDENLKKVRINQFFFKAGSAYDRKKLDPAMVAKMPVSDFDHIERCDLYFDWDAKFQRYKGGMQCETCTYDHAVDGKVYAEFEMILWKSQIWYRDRSMKVKDGCIRGEIDGFSWLHFDKKSPHEITKEEFTRRFPSLSKQMGTWQGTFRRYDENGKMTAEFASKITVDLDLKNTEKPYNQINEYTFADGKTQKIVSSGKIEKDKITFQNEQIEGYATEIHADLQHLSSMFYMKYKDGSYTQVYEIITLSEDGKNRMRATQYIKNGKILRRTLIDEQKTN